VSEFTGATVTNDYSESVMIALRPDDAVCKAFAGMDECSEDVSELHVTLFYLGSTEDCGGEPGRERLFRACYGHAISEPRPLVGKANGFGVFMNPDSDVLVALWDIPYIAEFRASLGDQCRAHGVPMREEDHGFTPHMTVTYDDGRIRKVPEIPEGGRAEVEFGSFFLVWGEEWNEITMVKSSGSDLHA
jgi:2'-5' RNA ligase